MVSRHLSDNTSQQNFCVVINPRPFREVKFFKDILHHLRNENVKWILTSTEEVPVTLTMERLSEPLERHSREDYSRFWLSHLRPLERLVAIINANQLRDDAFNATGKAA